MMDACDTSSDSAAGFLTMVEDGRHGLFGGYLLLSRNGRPVEFHCTAPVKPNRAQEILYGPTLGEYLYAEQIGRTLIAQPKSHVPVVYTDLSKALAVRHYVAQTVALVTAPDDPPSGELSERQWRLDGAHQETPVMISMQMGAARIEVLSEYDGDRLRLSRNLELLGPRFDLVEPFRRIREAIEEAQAGGKS